MVDTERGTTMGHDICGFKSADKAQETEIAYLHRGAGNPLARSIYEALGAQEHDCGCSGCGSTAHFTVAQLREALTKIPTDEEHEPERQFLRDCIDKGEGGAWVGFW